VTAALDLATHPIIDVDSHISEAPDLWTSRVPAKWHDAVPQIRITDSGIEEWWAGNTKIHAAGLVATAGWPEYMPSFPPTHAQIDPAAYDSKVRLERLDEHGIRAQVLFPNILGFATHAFLGMDDADLRLACVQAYNDYLAEFASADPQRLLPLMCVPFWDVEQSVAEIERAHELGHRGIVFASTFERIGLPALRDHHWDPVLATAQERNLSINFHTGFSQMSKKDMDELTGDSVAYDSANYAKQTALYHVGNINAIADIIMDGICARFPNLAFVSIESGFGYLPHLLEELDWQWHNSGAIHDHPGEPLPSEVFQRQVYGTFWHEHKSMALLDQLADNVMFESDFPHPTSLSPGPASTAQNARATVMHSLNGIDADVARKVLWDNGARLYGVQAPVTA
jgi:uncharacterized protein